jgi:hypothetical protein
LGYGNDALLTLFDSNCPNNAPPIFWRSGTYGGKQWFPLFAFGLKKSRRNGHTERMTQAVHGRVTDDRLTAASAVSSARAGGQMTFAASTFSNDETRFERQFKAGFSWWS